MQMANTPGDNGSGLITSNQTTQVPALTTDNLQSIPTAQVPALTTDQVQAVSTPQVPALTTGQTTALTTSQTSGFNNYIDNILTAPTTTAPAPVTSPHVVTPATAASVSTNPTPSDSPGLISAAMAQPTGAGGPVAATMDKVNAPTLGGAGGTSWQVDPNTMTVNGQLKKYLDPNSEIMQKAQADAMAQSADRGLLNSSMAATGGTAAMLDKAGTFATQDANMYGKSASDNAQNATSISNAQTGAAASMYGADKQAASSKYLADTQTNNLKYQLSETQKNDLQKMSLQYGFDVGKMDKQAALTLTQMDKAQVLDLQKMATAQGYTLDNMDAAQINAMAQLDKNATNSQKLAAMNIRAQQALNIDNQTFQKLMTGNAQEVGIISNLAQQINATQRDPNLTTTEAKDAAVRDLVNSARTAMGLVTNAHSDTEVDNLFKTLFPGVT